jgi:hypothetical protein
MEGDTQVYARLALSHGDKGRIVGMIHPGGIGCVVAFSMEFDASIRAVEITN